MLPLAQIVTILLDRLHRKLRAALPAVRLGFSIGHVGAVDGVLTMTEYFLLGPAPLTGIDEGISWFRVTRIADGDILAPAPED